MDGKSADDQKTEGLGQNECQNEVIQKDNTTTPSIEHAGDEDKNGKTESDINSTEDRVSLGFVDDNFIRQLVPS